MALGTVGLRSPRIPATEAQSVPTSDSATQTDIDVPTPRLLTTDTLSLASSQGEDHTGKSWASAVNDPWHPLILSLDGGGIRGYSSLLILKNLMSEIARLENSFERERPR